MSIAIARQHSRTPNFAATVAAGIATGAAALVVGISWFGISHDDAARSHDPRPAVSVTDPPGRDSGHPSLRNASPLTTIGGGVELGSP
jgi:hypothetical protein